MAKYLLAGLLLIAGLAGLFPTQTQTAPLGNASIQFSTDTAGVVTSVDVEIQRWSGSAWVRLGVRRIRTSCKGPDADCLQIPVLAGETWQRVRPSDAVLDPALGRAAVHVTIPFHDDVSNTDLPARLDVVWAGAGPKLCRVLTESTGCVRGAFATGDVALGGQPLLSGQTLPDGWMKWLSWHMPVTGHVP